MTVGSAVRDEKHVSFPGRRQPPIRTELVRGLANRAHHIGAVAHRFAQAGQIANVVMSAVQRRPDQGIHAGGDADVLNVAFALRLRHACEQNAGLRDDVAAGLEPELAVAMLPVLARRLADAMQP